MFDMVGGTTLERSWGCLRAGGVLVSIAHNLEVPEAARNQAKRGVWFIVEPDRAGLRALADLADEGSITPIVSEVVPLAEADRGYEIARSHGLRGKVVLAVSS